jgi:hypothetical protein
MFAPYAATLVPGQKLPIVREPVEVSPFIGDTGTIPAIYRGKRRMPQGNPMNKTSPNLLVFMLICASASTPALAATYTGKMSCKEFTAADKGAQPKMIYWAEGLSREGRAEEAMLDLDRTERLIPVVVDECMKNPQHFLVAQIKEAHKKSDLVTWSKD